MKRVLAATAEPPASPSAGGQPSQTCLSAASPNEPATAGNTNLANGRGVAAQYDVACYHQPAK